jgi:hypothetical protein
MFDPSGMNEEAERDSPLSVDHNGMAVRLTRSG